MWSADTRFVDRAQREELLARYRKHSRRFHTIAARGAPATELFDPASAPETPQPERAATAREIEVLQLVSEGLTNWEIGEQLHLSEETIKSHIRHLLTKLPAKTRAHAVAVGFRRRLLK